MKLLLVHGNQALLNFYAKVLGSREHEVLYYSNVHATLGATARELDLDTIEAAIIGTSIPDNDLCYTLLRVLGARAPNVRIIVVSGSESDFTRKLRSEGFKVLIGAKAEQLEEEITAR